MIDEDTPQTDTTDGVADSPPAELPAIEFVSPGSFAVHNPPAQHGERERREPAPFQLGGERELQHFTRPEQAQAHALALLQQAQRSLCIYTPDLERWLYHHSSVQDACTQFLLANPKNRLRILLNDPSSAVKEGHRLLQLSRRLSSNLHIRKLNPSYTNDEIAYLLADTGGLLMRPKLEQIAGYALYNDPGQVRVMQNKFDQAWDVSVSDLDLRSLLL
ncbi:MAG: histone acetyltransferase HPA2 [Pseudomonas sp.]|uniref:DUF7931 domain-containing protein n=1 Tax=Pseudomonas sp. TaxID=306 RepID=UPI0030F07C9B